MLDCRQHEEEEGNDASSVAMEVDECVVKYDFSHENCRKPLNEYAQAAKLFITSDKNKNNTKSAFEKGKCGDRSDLMHCMFCYVCA